MLDNIVCGQTGRYPSPVPDPLSDLPYQNGSWRQTQHGGSLVHINPFPHPFLLPLSLIRPLLSSLHTGMRQHQIVLNPLQLSGHHPTIGLRSTVFVADCNRRPNAGRVKRVKGKPLVEQVWTLLTLLRQQSLNNIHHTIQRISIFYGPS